MRTGTLAVIILTHNEEANIAQSLASVADWADETFIVDSLSTDKTLEISRHFDCAIVQHRFEDYAKQRNFALQKLPITSEWIFFLDADEWLPTELKEEITRLVVTSPPENGFYVRRRLMWMGRWIRRGYYPCWILRLARHGKVRCEDRPIDEHLIVEGATGSLRQDLIHEDRRGIANWIAKHNHRSEFAAQELLHNAHESGYQEIDASPFGTQPQRRRWIRRRVWTRLPPLVRPLAYFAYRYVVCGGFLDGGAAFTFHFLQALWYPMLVDIRYLELLSQQPTPTSVRTSAEHDLDITPVKKRFGRDLRRADSPTVEIGLSSGERERL